MEEFEKRLKELSTLAYQLLESCDTEDQVQKLCDWSEEFNDDCEKSSFAIIERDNASHDLAWWELAGTKLDPCVVDSIDY